jgi:hypothetical protein
MEKDFAIIIPTYKRKNGSTPSYIKNVSQMLKGQTYQNYKVFLIGDNYEDEKEFNQFKSLFYSPNEDKIFICNNNKSYRQGYFNNNYNKWAIGGIMAIKIGVQKAYREGYKYYLHLDDDDFWTSNKLEVLKNTLEQFPQAEFIFHASEYSNRILPIEHREDISLKYNNLRPRGGNIVHSTNVLKLSQSCYNLFLSYTNNLIQIAEDIKHKQRTETQLDPFDLGFVNLVNLSPGKILKCLYIPQILSKKNK